MNFEKKTSKYFQTRFFCKEEEKTQEPFLHIFKSFFLYKCFWWDISVRNKEIPVCFTFYYLADSIAQVVEHSTERLLVRSRPVPHFFSRENLIRPSRVFQFTSSILISDNLTLHSLQITMRDLKGFKRY